MKRTIDKGALIQIRNFILHDIIHLYGSSSITVAALPQCGVPLLFIVIDVEFLWCRPFIMNRIRRIRLYLRRD